MDQVCHILQQKMRFCMYTVRQSLIYWPLTRYYFIYLGWVTTANATSLFPACAAVSKHVRFCLLQIFKLAPFVNSKFTMVTWSCRQATCSAVSPSILTSSIGTLAFSSSWHAFTRLSFDAHINGVQWLLSLLHASAPSFNRMEQVFLSVGEGPSVKCLGEVLST